MNIESNVPASDEELAQDKNFMFSVNELDFEIKPLRKTGVDKVVKDSHFSTLLILFSDMSKDDLAKLIVSPKDYDLTDAVGKDKYLEKIKNTRQKLNNTNDFINITLDLIEPKPPWYYIKAFVKHNIKHWWVPKRWVFSLRKWFQLYLSHDDTLKLVSYFWNYSAFFLKTLYQILQKGIGSITNQSQALNQKKLNSTEQEFKRGWVSLGMEMMGSGSRAA